MGSIRKNRSPSHRDSDTHSKMTARLLCFCVVSLLFVLTSCSPEVESKDISVFGAEETQSDLLVRDTREAGKNKKKNGKKNRKMGKGKGRKNMKGKTGKRTKKSKGEKGKNGKRVKGKGSKKNRKKKKRGGEKKKKKKKKKK